jgi:hypothetical protein
MLEMLRTTELYPDETVNRAKERDLSAQSLAR